jgi:hypothetical protein
MRKGNLNNLIGLDLLLLAALGVTRAQIAFGAFDEKDVVTSPYAPRLRGGVW